jgi:hypothetical protein
VDRQKEPSPGVLTAFSNRGVLGQHNQKCFDSGGQRPQLFEKLAKPVTIPRLRQENFD